MRSQGIDQRTRMRFGTAGDAFAITLHDDGNAAARSGGRLGGIQGRAMIGAARGYTARR